MDKVEKILADIDKLRESIALDNEDIKLLELSGEQFQDVLGHIAWCEREIERLRKSLPKAPGNEGLGDPHSDAAT